MSEKKNKWFSLKLSNKKKAPQESGGCGCGKTAGGCSSHKPAVAKPVDGFDQVMGATMDRRNAFKQLTASLMVGAGAVTTACSVTSDDASKEKSQIDWEEQFKGNYKLMSEDEKTATVDRLVRSHQLRTKDTLDMSSKPAEEGVLFGYAFNISKCQGYMDCVSACVTENNQDRNSQMEYIRIHEMKDGMGLNFNEADDNYYHEVPAEGHFYMGTQCFHCDNPPCVEVCPV